MGTGYNEQNCKAWVQSVTKDNMALVSFPSSDEDKNKALVPLYELVERNATLENGGFDGEARYQALKAYMEGDEIAQDFSSYDCGTVTSFKVPTFSSDDESLIKDITIDGQWVGQVCNEFIPNINREARVTVVYPVINNQPRYNMGFFLGNRSHKPARVSWNGTNVAIEEYTNLDFGSVETLYLRGASISPTVYDGTVAIEGEVKDECLTAYGKESIDDDSYHTRDYRLVKIFDKIWLGEDFTAMRSRDNSKLIRGSFIGKSTLYYGEQMNDDKWKLAPVGWRVPSIDDYKDILLKLEANGFSLLGSAFLKDGVLGFNAPLAGYQIGSVTYDVGKVSRYWTDDEKTALEIEDTGSYAIKVYDNHGDYYSVRLVKK